MNCDFKLSSLYILRSTVITNSPHGQLQTLRLSSAFASRFGTFFHHLFNPTVVSYMPEQYEVRHAKQSPSATSHHCTHLLLFHSSLLCAKREKREVKKSEEESQSLVRARLICLLMIRSRHRYSLVG